MKKKLISILVGSILPFGLISAADGDQPPLESGKFYIFWYDHPKFGTQPLGIDSGKKAGVQVVSLKGSWALVEFYIDPRMALAVRMVAEVEKGSEEGQQFLTKSGKTKEEILKEASAHPLTSKQKVKMWINTALVQAITPLDSLENSP